ncbi:MAG: hypothetical protein E6I75_26305 [Chloroflexi bacterium]|nr:MAG: hypothetical protein E6I75_26305 [Chloroflexota bacterium]
MLPAVKDPLMRSGTATARANCGASFCSRTALAHEAELLALRDRQASLTPREREIMALVVSGLLNKQIAAKLGIREDMVKAHRGQVMRKMQVDSVADLVRVAAALDVPLVSHA